AEPPVRGGVHRSGEPNLGEPDLGQVGSPAEARSLAGRSLPADRVLDREPCLAGGDSPRRERRLAGRPGRGMARAAVLVARVFRRRASRNRRSPPAVRRRATAEPRTPASWGRRPAARSLPRYPSAGRYALLPSSDDRGGER